MEKKIRYEIYCEEGICVKGETLLQNQEIEKDGIRIKAGEEQAGKCWLGKLTLELKSVAGTADAGLRSERPVRIWLPVQRPEKMTAMYLYNPWWTRPAFIDSFQKIPEHTQVLFLKYKDRYACMVPVVGERFKTDLAGGTDTEVCMEMTAGTGGIRSLEEPLYLYAQARSLYEAVHQVFLELEDIKGVRMRRERRVPDMFGYLGWCSWDAFYREVSEAGVRAKAEELSEKKVPVGWMLIDDGWMKVKDQKLAGFTSDTEKFPEGFRKLSQDLKERNGIRWLGVWHALGGYWDGVDPDSMLASGEKDHLQKTAGGKLVPSPVTGAGFYRDWYEGLYRDGIRFVKVDVQSSAAEFFADTLPLAQSVRGIHEALEEGASRMDGAVINCMGMAMESIVSRPATALSRNSDDFMPDKPGGFEEHLIQNAFNSLYHNELYCCDWDMFWTRHPDAVKHSLLRAVSGGPVYVSDRLGETDPEILKPLVFQNGEILQMDHSPRPTEDCIFQDPLTRGVLKLQNTASWGEQKAGGIAAFNLTEQEQLMSFEPADIPELEQTERYWVYDYFSCQGVVIGKNAKYERKMKAGGYGWFVVLPYKSKAVCLGLIDKYAGFTAVQYVRERDQMLIAAVRKTGKLGWLSETAPSCVMVNGKNVTEICEREGCLYTVDLPEEDTGSMLAIYWNKDCHIPDMRAD